MSLAGPHHPSPYSSPRERLRKVDELDDDKQSTLSHSSGHSSGVPRAEQGKDALRLVAGNRVRHARCAPEFLEEIATKGIPDSLRKATTKKFKFIIGSDARTYFKNYIINYYKKESLRTPNETVMNQEMPAPIVFAVSVWDAGSKCVDYHMTWRGSLNTNKSREFEDKVNRFDKDFKRLADVLDKESRHLSSLRTYRNLSQTNRKSEKNSPTSPQSRKSHPPGITVSTPDTLEEKPDVKIDPSLPNPPPSAADSVMSLPLLNMVRGVPFSHRLPLRVTNPDRLSMLSEISIVPGKLPEGLSSKPGNQNDKEASNNISDPIHSKSSTITRFKRGANDETIKKSSDSIRSSDTKSSKSSRSSRSSSRSENRSSRNPSPGDGENSYHSSRRRKDSSKDEVTPEFIIVLLGDNLDIDIHSWHGLERQSSIRSVPAERHSPWIGPLASEEKENPYSRHYAYSSTLDDSESETSEQEREHWKNIPVIPMKPLMEAMGLVPNAAYYSPPPVVPGGLPYHQALSNAGSPQANSSPYLYFSPRLDSSPYVPAWLPQLPVPSNAASVPSRPLSRAYSSAYSSPYMQSHTGAF